MGGRVWLLPAACSVMILVASVATLLMLRHPGIVGCPGASFNPVVDCEAVVTNPNAHLFGLPLGVWGLVWLAGGVVSVTVASLWMHRWTVVWPALGLMGVAYAIGTEMRIGHLCGWCTLNQLAIVTAATWWIIHQRRALGHG